MPLSVPPRDAGSENPALIRQFCRQLSQAISRLAAGQSNAIGTVTLTASVASTVVNDARVDANSMILFDATTANAATELASGGMRVSARTQGQFTIAHANNVQTDRTFRYIVQG